MGQTKTIIELNGKRYNALTGEMLTPSDNVPPPNQAVHATKPPPPHAGKVLDGFTKQSKPVLNTDSQPTTQNDAHNKSLKLKSKQRVAAQHARHHSPERSKTLMRAAVHKPVGSTKKLIHSNTQPLDPLSIESQETSTNILHSTLDSERVKRAETIRKSSLVSKFSLHTPSFIKKAEHLQVQPAPDHIVPSISNVSTPLQTSVPATIDRPNPFSNALEHVNSHEQPRLKQPKLHRRAARKLGMSSKALGIVSSTLVALLIAGFIAYQNMPNLAMRVAAARAGFPATMPGYYPSGFSLDGAIQYYPGQITVNFKSNSDDRVFSITERPSKWTSETLLDHVITADRRPYQTYQDKGKVIYIYDGSNATWVNGGVWYEIEGNSSLTSDQLLRIASSL